MKCLYCVIIIKIKKGIQEFFCPTMESLINKFAIVEKETITQEECDELLKILDEWNAVYSLKLPQMQTHFILRGISDI